VANDSKLFDRLRAGSSCTISTFEKLLAFFRIGENWTDNCIPDSALMFLERLDNISTDGAMSSGKAREIAA